MANETHLQTGLKEPAPAPTRTSDLSTSQLVIETTREAMQLIKSEIELAKTELKADVARELSAIKTLGLALLGAVAALNLLLVSGALGLATVMPAWAAGLAVTGVVALVAAIAGAVGWKHVKAPLARTRKSLEEDARWVKERTT
jgi:uncharacterized membrane protein YqjE